MKLNRFESLSDATTTLTKQGFDKTFKLEGDKLMCLENHKQFSADELEVIAYHRFEGVSNPDDMSILYVVEGDDETKGLVVVPYGNYGDNDLALFMQDVEIDPEERKTP